MDFDTNNHSVFLLQYHLIMCIRYRNKVIDHKISERLKEIFGYICPEYNITLEEWNHDIDHVPVIHTPKTALSLDDELIELRKRVKEQDKEIRRWQMLCWISVAKMNAKCNDTYGRIRMYQA